MIVSINQPAYLPWLGYFHRIAISDIHIVLDHVQFEKNSFTNRNKIRTKEGWVWLTVPLQTKGKFGQLEINRLMIDNSSNWASKHWKSIQFNYSKAPQFGKHAVFFQEIYTRSWTYLNDLMREMTHYLLDAFGIKTSFVFSSELKVQGQKDELVLNLCREVGATHYLSGPLGRDYLQLAPFEAAGIKVSFRDYQHSPYPQAYPGFEPYMAAIDLLFNCGDQSMDVMSRNQESL